MRDIPYAPPASSAAEPRWSATGSLVLLHASAGSARQWQALETALPAGWRALSVELHGHGAQPPWRAPRPMRLDDEVALVLERLPCGEPVHLVGHSYGGAVALAVALRQPQRLASLTLYEPVLFPWLAAEDNPACAAVRRLAAAIGAAVAAGDEASLADAARQFIDYWSGPGAWQALPVQRRAAIVPRMADIARQFDAIFAARFAPEALRRLPLRGLSLSGASTVASTARIAALLRRDWPQARHGILDGAGHMGPLTHAAAFNARLLAFVGATAPLVLAP